jgi:hypothetical protein
MPVIKKSHQEECWRNNFADYLIDAAPDILWYNVQDIGSYQGTVYAVGEYKKQIVIFEEDYGSCSSCGAWGKGGEPKNQKKVLSLSQLFTDPKKAKEAVDKIGMYDCPDKKLMKKAIDEICS